MPSPAFQPYIPADREPVELTVSAVLLGMVLGLVFAASSVYLALKVGLTVSASIPIAVLSITIFRAIQNAMGATGPQILRNNIVQTTGSAGESIAAGTVFTLPGLLLLGYALPWTKVAAIALVGSMLGVLLMIPLRRRLIVEEHDTLRYPEGTACAEVLIVGEERGAQARTVFLGFGLGALYKFLNSGLHLWAEVPAKTFEQVTARGRQFFGEIQAEVSPELTGVGYIIGPKVASYLFGGGLIAYFVLIPAIKLFGAGLTSPMFPATITIAEMTAAQVRSNYVFYIGAGAVTAAGLINLARVLPTIVRALATGLSGMSRSSVAANKTDANGGKVPRTEQDLPMSVVVIGVVLCIVAMVSLPQIGINLVGALLAVLFAFLFVTVSSRVCGQIGSSANPISGMTVAAVLMTSLIFLAIGWTGIEHRVLALSIGGVVCIAAAVAAATSQDLKTGYLVGATPKRQQMALFAGTATSAILVGFIINALNISAQTIVARDYPGVKVDAVETGVTETLRDGQSFTVAHLYTAQGAAPAGKYLVDAQGEIKYLVDPGIGGREAVDYTGRTVRKLDSPKAQIMALVVDGILTQRLPWGLVLIGAFLAIAMELLGLPSLAVAVGVYLPISTSAAIFTGGAVRWFVDRRSQARAAAAAATPDNTHDDADSGPGVLFSSGLIAGGAITGLVLAALAVGRLANGNSYADALSLAPSLGTLAESALLALAAFVIGVVLPLWMVAKKDPQ